MIVCLEDSYSPKLLLILNAENKDEWKELKKISRELKKNKKPVFGMAPDDWTETYKSIAIELK
jgi:hypothetical protein